MNSLFKSQAPLCARHRSRASLYFAGALLLFVCLLPGCGKISSEIRSLNKGPLGLIDFAKTEILDNGPVPADGSSELTLAIHLKNSDNTSVPSYRPTYEIVSGLGVLPSNCSTSDANGVSICLLKATQPGTKKLRLTNAREGLEHNLLFDPLRRKGQAAGLAAAGNQMGTTNSSYKVQVTVGEETQGAQKISTNRGYQVQISIQGLLLSQ